MAVIIKFVINQSILFIHVLGTRGCSAFGSESGVFILSVSYDRLRLKL